MSVSEYIVVSVYPNCHMRSSNNGVVFEGESPVLLRIRRLSFLSELKRLILTSVGANGNKEVRRIGYRFLAPMGNRVFRFRVFWLDGDEHVRLMFDVHGRIMAEQVMELSAEIGDIGGTGSGHSDFVNMGTAEERVVAVIMVGRPTKGTRFRPLSFNIPKPLFPLAGQPMVHHPISACKRIPNLAQIYLIGFYEECEFALFVSSVSNELKVPIKYLKEDKPHGSAGGFYSFRDQIMEDDPSHIFLLNCDVCCSFPLPEMLDAHRKYGGMGTILVKVSPESAGEFGELVVDPVTNELLHYTEKPETFVSDRINCGVYIFTPDIFTAIEGVTTQ